VPGEKTAFLRHLYIKIIFLPRQARDKHRKNSKKSPFSRSCPQRAAITGKQTELFCPLSQNDDRFTKPGLGRR
jgi:hypothetical protein